MNPRRRVPYIVRAPYGMVKFTGTGTITWTVDVADYEASYPPASAGFNYAFVDNFLLWSLYLEASTISGTGNQAVLTLPAGIVMTRQVCGQCFVGNAGVWTAAKMLNNATQISLMLANEANFSASTNNFHVNAGGIVEVQPPYPRIY